LIAALALAACSGDPEGGTSRPAGPATTETRGGAAAVAPPAAGPPAKVVDRGDPNRRVVALTFDAGADPGFTAQILDTLGARRVRATFGITGQWAEQNSDLVRRMAAEGYQVINHTWDHSSFTGRSSGAGPLNEGQRLDQIRRTDDLIQQLTGQTTRPWFRPPYGDYDDSVNAVLGTAGYRYNAMWTVDSLGWMRVPTDDIVQRCLGRAVPGAIYLFHVGSQSQDAAALPAIIGGLEQAGYSFGTLTEVTGLR
jgi:peptidoglycan/xylan/chitin deacetylase (PgdA/CDA1 family)